MLHGQKSKIGEVVYFLTLPCLESRGFLVPRDGLQTQPLRYGCSGHFSPGVPSLKTGEAVPLCPKVQCDAFAENVERGIVVPVKYQPASGADVCAHGQGLLDDPPAAAALLGGEGWLHRQHRNALQEAVVSHPPQEGSPTRIVNTLGEMPVALHVAYL